MQKQDIVFEQTFAHLSQEIHFTLIPQQHKKHADFLITYTNAQAKKSFVKNGEYLSNIKELSPLYSILRATQKPHIQVEITAWPQMYILRATKKDDIWFCVMGDMAITQESPLHQRLIKAFFESVPDAFFALDMNHMVSYANPATMTFFSTDKPKSPINKRIEDVIPHAIFANIKESLLSVMKTHEEKKFEIYAKSLKVWLRIDIYPIHEGICIFIRKLPERNQSDLNRTILSAIVTSSGDAIIGKNNEQIITAWNQAAEKLYGFKETEVLGKNASIYEGDIPDTTHYTERQMQTSHDPISFETRRQTKNKQNPLVAVSVSPIKDYDGNIIGVSSIERDITKEREAEKALTESESKYKFLTDAIPHIICTTDAAGNLDYVNKQWIEYTGTTLEDFKKAGHFGITDRAQEIITNWKHAVQTGEVFEMKYRVMRISDNTFRWHLVRAVPYKDNEGHIMKWFGSMTDIDDQERAKEKLLQSEERFRALIENSNDAIIITNKKGIITYATQSAKKITSYDPDELIGKDGLNFLYQKDFPYAATIHKDVLEHPNKSVPFTFRYKNKYGNTLWIEGITTNLLKNPQVKGIVSNFHDITERKAAEDKIKKSLREKEAMLKEIHHRVKNNLQIISSLLNLQARTITSPLEKDLFQESQNRVKAMSLVHEKLYLSEDLESINIKTYTQNLVNYLFRAYKNANQEVLVFMDIQENMNLDLEQAISFSLILNEILSNSLKHAFHHTNKGEVHILAKKKKQQYHITISDNGSGIPKEITKESTHSLGIQLIYALVAQLNGSITIERDNGTTFTIVFTPH